MNIGILYTCVAYVSCIVVIIVRNRVTVLSGSAQFQKPFSKLLVFFMLFTAVDGTWGIFFSKAIKSFFFLNLFTYAFHLLAALSAFMWSGYMRDFLKAPDATKKAINTVRSIILFIQLVLLGSNLVAHYAFNITPECDYLPTPLRDMTFYIQFSYYLIIMFFSITSLIRKSNTSEKQDRLKTSLFFSAIPLLFGIGQMKFPDAPFYSMGFMLTSVAIYGFNVTAEREKVLDILHRQERDKFANIVNAFSTDYDSVYYGNLNKDTFESVRLTDTFRESHPGLYDIMPFSDFSRKAEKFVHPDDVVSVHRELSPENIREKLDEDKSFYINYRQLINGTIQYYRIKILRTENWETDNEFMFGTSNVDELIRQQMEREMEQKRKAEAASLAKSTFLFNMSHDIRTPMNAIKGFTELAERNIDDKDKVTEYLGKVKASSNHLLSLINDVLDMSRIESGKVIIDEVPANIRVETEKLLSMMEVTAKEKGISLEYDTSGLKDIFIYADTLHVTQIILNVLSNAIKYTKAGGSVFYSIDQLPDSTKTTASYCITVKDTGIGMSPDFQEHLFEEFARESNTTKSGVEGTGLGMSIVKHLVDMMNGRIDVTSEQGKGTTIKLYMKFRIADTTPHAVAADRDTAEKNILKGKRLLLVEDNEFNREIAREILEDEGITVEEAEDGAIAIEKVTSHTPDYYDFILMDIQLPNVDGYEATRTIRSLKNADYSSLPIIATTANAFEEDVKNALDAGMNGHLSKPIEIPKLIECLKQNLQK